MNKKYLLLGVIAALLVVGGVYYSGKMNKGYAASPTIDNKTTTETVMVKDNETVKAMPNLVETADSAGTFKTLITAVRAAGLENTLAETGPLTVFAPIDEAFAKLPEGTVESLLANPEKLAKILTYHVVDGKLMTQDVVKTDMITTLNGGELMVNVENGEVMVNESMVIATDIEAENGLIHVIDTVLLPS